MPDCFVFTIMLRWWFFWEREYHVWDITWAQACKLAEFADERELSYTIARI